MRTCCLVLIGVLVGWAASGVDWTCDAIAEEKADVEAAALRNDPLMPEASLPPRNQALIADGPIIGPMVEISSSRDARKVVVPNDVGRYQAMTRVEIEKLGGRPKVDGIIGANDLKYLTAGLNALAAAGWSLTAIEQAHRYTITGPAGSSITTPATYIFKRQ